MRFQNIIENARLTIQVLILGLSFSFLINVLLSFGWYLAQRNVKVYLPPQIPIDGLTLTQGEYPPATIFSFAYYIWQGINYWPKNGAEDYKQSIEQFSPFITPHFKSFLMRDYNERYNQGEIQDRLRTLQGTNGSAFKVNDVKAIGHNTWLVHLHLRLTEHMNINGDQVKNTSINYILRVVGYPSNSNVNPWGLALDGFEVSPNRSNVLSIS